MLIRTPEQDIERVLFTEKAIAARVEQLGADLTAKLGDKRPVLVCVLKGASFFYIDLCRCMNCAIDMDFIAVSSYGASAQSTGVVRLIKELDKVILSKGAWTTILFRYQELDAETGEYGPDKYAIRRYQKSGGEYRQKSKFIISSAEQARKIVDALSGWRADA